MIEVEVRGKIEDDFDKVLDLFNQKAKFIEEKDRFSLIYFRHEVVKDVREIRDEKVDLRLRVTNKNAELTLNYGIWGGNDVRKEISIPILLDKFSDFVNSPELPMKNVIDPTIIAKDKIIIPDNVVKINNKGHLIIGIKNIASNYRIFT